MRFGLYNALATLEKLMESVLGDLDDINVMGKTFEEHLKNLCVSKNFRR